MSRPPPLARTPDRLLFDRRLFLAAAILFPAIVVAGFARTYYLKGLFGTPPLPSTIVHAHGVVMTTWVLLFVTQVGLISSKRVRLHQRLGYAGIGLGVLILATGVPTALRAAKYGSLAAPRGIPPLAFLAVPFFDLVMFTILFGAAVAWRRRPAEHKGLMLLTALNFLPPALARIPVPALLAAGPLWFFGVPTAFAVTSLILQARRYGGVNRVVLAGTLLLIGSYVFRLWIMSTDRWLGFASWATGLV